MRLKCVRLYKVLIFSTNNSFEGISHYIFDENINSSKTTFTTCHIRRSLSQSLARISVPWICFFLFASFQPQQQNPPSQRLIFVAVPFYVFYKRNDFVVSVKSIYIYKCTSHSILAHTKCLFCYCVCIKNNGGKVQENPWKHIASQKPYSNGFYKDADQIGAPSKMQRKNMLDWCMCVYILCVST